MATHSSVLAWRIPGTAGPGGLPSMGSHRVGHERLKRLSSSSSSSRAPPWLGISNIESYNLVLPKVLDLYNSLNSHNSPVD